jgi:hypothetical protein
MSEADRTMWAREVKKITNKIAYRRKTIADAEKDIPGMEARLAELNQKIADDYAEEHGG